MANIVHFEIPADDVNRAQKFYGDVFGWSFRPVGAGPSEYWMINTGGGGNGGPEGGMLRRPDPKRGITNYIDVEEVEASLAAVQKAGGRVAKGRTAVPGFGYFALCADPEGNLFGVWQADAEAS